MRRAGWFDLEVLELQEFRFGKGADEYGEDGFLERDCVKEAIEEAIDGAGGWATLEHQKNLIGDTLGPEDEFLMEAAADFMRAYRNLTLYRLHKYGR